LWSALELLAAAIEEDIKEAAIRGISITDLAYGDEAEALSDFPVITRTQTTDWWRAVAKAAWRMSGGIATGLEWSPRTPAEEAVVHVATTFWVPMVDDMLNDDPDVVPEYRLLPPDPEDFEWPEVLPSLAGDADIEQLWWAESDGIEDPANEINQAIGMGDYRPQNWHRLFDSFVPDPGTSNPPVDGTT